jgi:hypothetical protein
VSDEIKPRVDEDGVAWCDLQCEQAFVFHKARLRFCKLIDHAQPDLDGNVCPVHARRMAQWAERARSYIEFAVGVASNREVYDDGIALLADYPGEQGGE